jgi:hypothetical protein
MPKPAQEEEEADFADLGAVLAAAKPGNERRSETRTFTILGKAMKFEIYTDGADDAEVWQGLLSAMQHGYMLQIAARATGQQFAGIDIKFPVGTTIKEFTVKDPAYIGNMKVLSMVLKRPAWGLDECLMMGHELGAEFYAVTEWAARANRVTEHFNKELRELEKNAPTLSRPETSS